jgi:hypothetical protein
MYFEIYGISKMMKVKFSMLNFVGNAALWLRTIQSKQYIIHWEDLYKSVESYWGKNKFNLFRRQILTIRQVGTVAEYTEKFNHLKHQILLHDPSTSEVFFAEYITMILIMIGSSQDLNMKHMEEKTSN